jgi:Tfp pilus assembly protein PilF
MRKGIDLGLARERSVDLLIQDGVWKLRAGDPAHARASIEEALKINPTDVRALAALNQTYLAEKGASALALQKVKEYAAHLPKSAPVQDFLGMMLMGQGDRVEARAAFTAAKTADSRFVRSDMSLVQIDVLESKFEDARKRLDAVLAADSGNNTARLWLGNIEEILGHHNAALDHFRKAVENNPGNAQASNNLAYMLTEYGNQPDEALKYAEKAVQLAPTHAAYSDTMGWILYRKGLYTQAIGYLERANSDAADVVWKYHLAMAYAKAGNAARGRATLQAALKLNPNVPEAKIAQGIVEQSH